MHPQKLAMDIAYPPIHPCPGQALESSRLNQTRL